MTVLTKRQEAVVELAWKLAAEIIWQKSRGERCSTYKEQAGALNVEARHWRQFTVSRLQAGLEDVSTSCDAGEWFDASDVLRSKKALTGQDLADHRSRHHVGSRAQGMSCMPETMNRTCATCSEQHASMTRQWNSVRG